MITTESAWYRELPGLQEVRERQHLSREDLSRFSGVSVQAIEGLEAGRRKTSALTAAKLALTLYVTVSELEGRS